MFVQLKIVFFTLYLLIATPANETPRKEKIFIMVIIKLES